MTEIEKYESLKNKISKLREFNIKIDVEIENHEKELSSLKTELNLSDADIELYKNKSEVELKKIEDEISTMYSEIQTLKGL